MHLCCQGGRTPLSLPFTSPPPLITDAPLTPNASFIVTLYYPSQPLTRNYVNVLMAPTRNTEGALGSLFYFECRELKRESNSSLSAH